MDTNRYRFFFSKLKNRVALQKNSLWKYCNIEHLSFYGFKGFANYIDTQMRLHSMLGVYTSSLLEGINKEENRLIILTAEQVLRHEFDLLGSGLVMLDPIDWQIDYKSGFRWEKRFYKDLNTPKGADIKCPWELSRCQHLLWLGEAWILTKEQKYAQEVIDEISWWIEDNPLMYTVNWTCAMEVAFRAVNWLFAMNMISDYEGFDDVFTEKVTRSLWQHGFFIRNNLERQIPFSNNHYAADIVGLLYLGTLFNHTTKGRRWFRFAFKEYIIEVCTQVLPSGVHYERSVSYHRLMTELFSYPIYMLKRIGKDVPQKVSERVNRMYDYVSTYTKPNGYAPLIADNDDGRFVPFFKRDFRNHNYLNNPDGIENTLVSAGCPVLFHSSSHSSQLYADAGFAINRQRSSYLFVTHGGFSKNPKVTDNTIGTQTHNDLLSYELCFNGEDFLIDAGTYLYTSSIEDRDEFRSTAKHNTIIVDGEEQNGMIKAFVLKRNVRKSDLKQISDNVYEGEYTTIEGQMHHKRRFDFVGQTLIITDTIVKAGVNHDVKLYFHFAPGLSPSIIGKDFVVNNKIKIGFSISPEWMNVMDDTISPSFGILEKSVTGVASFCFSEQLVLRTTIYTV